MSLTRPSTLSFSMISLCLATAGNYQPFTIAIVLMDFRSNIHCSLAQYSYNTFTSTEQSGYEFFCLILTLSKEFVGEWERRFVSSAKIGSFRNRCRWPWTREQRWPVAVTHNILVFVPPSATPTEVRWEREKSYRRERCATMRRRGGWWWWRGRGGGGCGERERESAQIIQCLGEKDGRS